MRTAEKLLSSRGSDIAGDSTHCVSSICSDSRDARDYLTIGDAELSFHREELMRAQKCGPISRDETKAWNQERENRHAEESKYLAKFDKATKLDHAVDINIRVSGRKATRSLARLGSDIDRNRAILDVFPSWKKKFGKLCASKLEDVGHNIVAAAELQ